MAINRPVLKSFLGEKPTKVVEKYSLLTKEEYQAISSVDNYLLSKDNSIYPFKNLSAGVFGGTASLKKPVVYLGKDVYVPLKITFSMPLYHWLDKRMRVANYVSHGLVYIMGIGKRPALPYIDKAISELLSSEYTGQLENRVGKPYHGRYVICLNNANKEFIRTLLNICMDGDGKVIDYTWIAPLQDLLEQLLEEEEKRLKAVKRGVNHIDDDFEIPSAASPHTFNWAQKANTPRAGRFSAKGGLELIMNETVKKYLTEEDGPEDADFNSLPPL